MKSMKNPTILLDAQLLLKAVSNETRVKILKTLMVVAASTAAISILDLLEQLEKRGEKLRYSTLWEHVQILKAAELIIEKAEKNLPGKPKRISINKEKIKNPIVQSVL